MSRSFSAQTSTNVSTLSENQPDDKNELIREMSEKIKSLEEKEKNRVNTPWGVYDKKGWNILI